MLDQHGPTPPPQEGEDASAAAASAAAAATAAPYDPNQPPPGPPPSGLNPYTSSYNHGQPYIHDPSGYLTANLALAEQYAGSAASKKKKSRSKKKKAAKASAGAGDKHQITTGGGGYAAPVNPRKQKPCKVGGCPRQSRGVRFDFMCQRHCNEARGIKSNCVDWRMLLQRNESNPGRDTKQEEVEAAKVEEKQRAKEAQKRRDEAVAEAVAQAVAEEEKEKDEGDAIEALTKLSKGKEVAAV